jgi:hypothetical protein
MSFAKRLSAATIGCKPDSRQSRVIHSYRVMVKQATLAASFKGEQLYARVDGLEIGGRLIVMEVELVEPDLFFLVDPTAALRFATALKRSLANMQAD